MSNKKTTPKAPKADTNTVQRSKRTSFERKCLSKSYKRLFCGMGKEVFKLVLAAERQSKKKQRATEKKVEETT